MIQPSSKAISKIVEKLKTLKAKETDFLDKKYSTTAGKDDNTSEEKEAVDLPGKPKKPKPPLPPSMEEILRGISPSVQRAMGLGVERTMNLEDAKRNLSDSIQQNLLNYEKQKIKPKEYWPDDIQSLIDEIEILMYPYGKKFSGYGGIIKTGLLSLDYIIQELEKIKYKIEVEAQQKPAETDRTKSEQPASGGKAGVKIKLTETPLAAKEVTPKAERREPVSKKAGLILEKLKSLPEHKGMTRPELQSYVEQSDPEGNTNLDDGTFKDICKELAPYGLKNKKRIGYYINE